MRETVVSMWKRVCVVRVYENLLCECCMWKCMLYESLCLCVFVWVLHESVCCVWWYVVNVSVYVTCECMLWVWMCVGVNVVHVRVWVVCECMVCVRVWCVCECMLCECTLCLRGCVVSVSTLCLRLYVVSVGFVWEGRCYVWHYEFWEMGQGECGMCERQWVYVWGRVCAGVWVSVYLCVYTLVGRRGGIPPSAQQPELLCQELIFQMPHSLVPETASPHLPGLATSLGSPSPRNCRASPNRSRSCLRFGVWCGRPGALPFC